MSSLEDLKKKYLELAHAVQSGVAFQMIVSPAESGCSPKHLRTGVNMAMCSESATARLLMQKGVFTEEEYFQMLVNVLEEEVRKYEESLGPNVKLR